MPERRKITLSLGEKLKLLRKRFFKGGLKELSEKMGGRYSVSGISRRESNVFKVDWDYLQSFCEAIQLPEKEKQLLISSVLLSMPIPNHEEYEEAFAKLVQGARKIEDHTLTINFCLQTVEYTYHILCNFWQAQDAWRMANERRSSTDQMLQDGSKNFRLTFPESALYIPIGSAKVMQAQLQKLLDFKMSENLEFRVLPDKVFVPAPAHYFFTVVDGQFAMSEHCLGTASENSPARIESLKKRFEVIWQAAATGERLRGILQEALEYYSTKPV